MRVFLYVLPFPISCTGVSCAAWAAKGGGGMGCTFHLLSYVLALIANTSLSIVCACFLSALSSYTDGYAIRELHAPQVDPCTRRYLAHALCSLIPLRTRCVLSRTRSSARRVLFGGVSTAGLYCSPPPLGTEARSSGALRQRPQRYGQEWRPYQMAGGQRTYYNVARERANTTCPLPWDQEDCEILRRIIRQGFVTFYYFSPSFVLLVLYIRYSLGYPS